ncbi:MAG: hypothetical protein ACO23T_06535 [Hylemonella sp.]
MNTKFLNYLAMAMLALFFLPYVLKLKQIDLILILLGGLAMPLYDLLSDQESKKENRS